MARAVVMQVPHAPSQSFSRFSFYLYLGGNDRSWRQLSLMAFFWWNLRQQQLENHQHSYYHDMPAKAAPRPKFIVLRRPGLLRIRKKSWNRKWTVQTSRRIKTADEASKKEDGRRCTPTQWNTFSPMLCKVNHLTFSNDFHMLIGDHLFKTCDHW